VSFATTAVLIVDVEDQLRSLWLDACRLQMIAEDQDTAERWEAAAHAWAKLAKEIPDDWRADLAVYWNLAASAMQNAKVPPTPAASQGGPGDAHRRRGRAKATSKSR
jgi:hypothetical protein